MSVPTVKQDSFSFVQTVLVFDESILNIDSVETQAIFTNVKNLIFRLKANKYFLFQKIMTSSLTKHILAILLKPQTGFY